MKRVFVVVGQNNMLNNISARAAFKTRELAQEWIDNPELNYFDDKTHIVEVDYFEADLLQQFQEDIFPTPDEIKHY